jgi:hypothetical protein
MNRQLTLSVLCWLLAATLSPALTRACTLCTFNGGNSNPLAKEVSEAKLVVYGKITNARLGPDGIRGTCDVAVESLIKGDATLVKGNSITLPRYVPPSPGVTYLIFLDVNNGQFDPYRNIVCSSDRIVQYLKKMPPVQATSTSIERQSRLHYTFDYLQDDEPELAADAYKEWALASNQDVAAVAGKLDASKLRRWLMDPKTPAHCIGLYAYLLGSCGDAGDVERLKQLVLNPTDARFKGALDGLLAGYHRAKGAASWEFVRSVAGNKDRDFGERHAILRLLRFVHDVDGEAGRKDIVSCCDQLMRHTDTLDLVIEQLRQWSWWERSETVFQLFGTPAAQAPMTRRAIVRYALKCPETSAKSFLEKVRKDDPALVKDVEEWMQLMEKP